MTHETDPKKISEALGALSIEGSGSEALLWFETGGLRPALEKLKREHAFNMLVDLTALDFSAHAVLKTDRRFKLVYRLMRLNAETGLVDARVALAAWLDGDKGPPSAKDLWPCADWLEREVWDMFGIRFSDRPDIKRILLYEEFVGHPLRKDYPIAKRQPLVGPKENEARDRMLDGDLRPKVTP